jgi:Spy/CpxP family protein refolding chaperone
MEVLFNHSFMKRKTPMKLFFRRNLQRALFGIFGAALLVGGLTACGHHRHDYGAAMSAEQYAQTRDKMVDRVASRLDLNADQKTRLAALGDTLYAQRAALMGQTKDPHAEMKALVAGDKFDAARAQALITEKTTVIQAKSPEVLAALASFYDSLNPAQQQKVRDFMEGRHGWFHRG